MNVQALFIDPKGPYPAMLGVENCWDEKRDARLFAGPGPVLAHPPCAAWCQLAGLRQHKYGLPKGEDDGCFAAALRSLLAHGGVLEHPAYSKAWPAFGLAEPGPRGSGWRQIPIPGNVATHGRRLWTCTVSQVAYGHRARKRTYLLYCGYRPPFELDWSEPKHEGVVSGSHNHCKADMSLRLWGREAKRTPLRFANALWQLARWSAFEPDYA